MKFSCCKILNDKVLFLQSFCEKKITNLNMKRLLFSLFIMGLMMPYLFSQNTGVSITSDNSAPDNSAMLDIKSTTKGLLIPRMTQAQRTQITNAATGLMVFQTDQTTGVYYWAGSAWLHLTDDNTASTVPVGTIVAFAGTTVPTGWLLCDGTLFSTFNPLYTNLYAAIGNAWGGTANISFNVPDLRGRFMRGVDGTAGNDPDKTSRTAINTGGNTGNAVGSLQADTFKSHTHTYYWPKGGDNEAVYTPNGDAGITVNLAATETIAVGGNETRPKNVNVNYIIKY
jgi:microcystin-dependent protein